MAWSDSQTFTFDWASSGLAGAVGPYGTVELTVNGAGGIDFDIKLPTNWFIADGLVGHDVFGFNAGLDPTVSIDTFNSSAYSADSPLPNITNVGLDCPASTGCGKYTFDGAGNFEYAVKGPVIGANTAVSELTFTVSKVTGTFASIDELVEDSGSGYWFSTEVGANCGRDPTTGDLRCGASGFVGVSDPAAVPEPRGYIWLLGAGLAILMVYRAKPRDAWKLRQ